jgi:hypothetical protein
MITKRTKVSLALFLLVGLTSSVLWLTQSPSVEGRAPAVSQKVERESPLAGLNRKAKASKGTNPFTVDDLTRDVVATFATTDMPNFTQEGVKERVAKAELSYRQGVDKGISEVKVARTINELADKFALPDYAKVSVAMVRTTRVILMLEVPDLVGQNNPADKNNNKKKKIGSSISPFMSPLEATALTLFLLQQKTLNEAYQVSHKEFFENLNQKQMGKWGQLRAKRDGYAQSSDDPQAPSINVKSNTRTEEMDLAVKKAAAAMRPDELLNLADSSLDTLGIKRLKENTNEQK